MMDPRYPLGVLVGHGGGGPGYAAAVFAVPAVEAVVVVLTSDERHPAQAIALALLDAAVRGGR
jgi:NAD(P)H-hydrate repair Nnr-like enzyme with NAD(P)H-hydrate epimerase domain